MELRFHSDAGNLAPVRACVERFAAEAGFDEDRRALIALAVDEAISNCICHGYHGRTDGPITLRLETLASGGLRIEIEDEGDQVDPREIKPRDLSELRPGGLGVHIIQTAFQRCLWRRREQRGMSVTLELELQHDGINAALSRRPAT